MSEPAADAPVQFRVLSYNVRGLRDDTAALAEVVRGTDPDVICVQEAPKYVRWRAKGAELARQWGVTYVAGGGSTGGTALYAHLRVDVDQPVAVVTSRQFGWPDRGIAAAMVSKAGATLAVASIHLPLVARGRVLYGDRVRDLLETFPTTHRLAAGDLNELPDGPSWKALHGCGLSDLDPQCGPTFPAARPRKRIDGVFATDGVRVVQHQVVDTPAGARASDHLPLLAVVTVPVRRPSQLSSPGRSPAR